MKLAEIHGNPALIVQYVRENGLASDARHVATFMAMHTDGSVQRSLIALVGYGRTEIHDDPFDRTDGADRTRELMRVLKELGVECEYVDRDTYLFTLEA